MVELRTKVAVSSPIYSIIRTYFDYWIALYYTFQCTMPWVSILHIVWYSNLVLNKLQAREKPEHTVSTKKKELDSKNRYFIYIRPSLLHSFFRIRRN